MFGEVATSREYATSPGVSARMAFDPQRDTLSGFTLTEVLVAVVVLVIAFECFVCVVPPGPSTHSAMVVSKRRIIRHVAAHGELPTSVAETSELEGYNEGLIDGWGEPIRFATSDGVVTLRSAGPDGQFVTSDDVVGQFAVWDTDGEVVDEMAPWTLEPGAP